MDFNQSQGPIGSFNLSLLTGPDFQRPGTPSNEFLLHNAIYFIPFGVWAARGAYLVSNLALRPGVGFLRLNLLPFTYNVTQAGVLALAIDVAAYKVSGLVLGKAFDLVIETNRLVQEWIDNVSLEELRQALGQKEFDRLTANGTVKNVNFLFQMPPMWLTDP